MAAPGTEERTRSPRRALVGAGLALVALVALAALATTARDGDDVAVRSAGPGSEGTGPVGAPDADGSTPTTAAPTTSAPGATTTTAAGSDSTTTTPPTTAPPTTAAPTATGPPPDPAPAPTEPEGPAPSTGTLDLDLEPPEDGWSKHVWVAGPDGATVLPRTAVTGPIAIEGLAPGTYEVFVGDQGPPYGPDEDGVELGGGSRVIRVPTDVVAGETATVTDRSV